MYATSYSFIFIKIAEFIHVIFMQQMFGEDLQ